MGIELFHGSRLPRRRQLAAVPWRRAQAELFSQRRHSQLEAVPWCSAEVEPFSQRIPEAVVMEIVGHDFEQISAHYTHVGREALEKAAAALPEI